MFVPDLKRDIILYFQKLLSSNMQYTRFVHKKIEKKLKH